MVLKVELITYLYNLSERQVEVYINENLPAKYFVGTPVKLVLVDRIHSQVCQNT
ncbi:MAG: transposase [Chloroflexi bacterium]|nr:transposase [Chloroflexota bacterium]